MEMRLLKDVIACQAWRQGFFSFRSVRIIFPLAITTQNVAEEMLYHVRCDSSFRFLIDVTFRFPCGGACVPQKSIKGFLRVAYDALYKHCFQQILTVAAQEVHRKTNY